MFLGNTVNSFHNSFIAVLARERVFEVSAVGIIFMITAFSEIPFLLCADKVIKKLGNLKVLIIGMVVIGIRMIIISFSADTLTLFFAEMLHGLTYILMYYSVFDYIHFHLPERYLTTTQSIFWFVRSGLTFVFGSIGGGLLMELFQTTQTFRFFGILGLISASAIIVIALVHFRSLNKN